MEAAKSATLAAMEWVDKARKELEEASRGLLTLVVGAADALMR